MMLKQSLSFCIRTAASGSVVVAHSLVGLNLSTQTLGRPTPLLFCPDPSEERGEGRGGEGRSALLPFSIPLCALRAQPQRRFAEVAAAAAVGWGWRQRQLNYDDTGRKKRRGSKGGGRKTITISGTELFHNCHILHDRACLVVWAYFCSIRASCALACCSIVPTVPAAGVTQLRYGRTRPHVGDLADFSPLAWK